MLKRKKAVYVRVGAVGRGAAVTPAAHGSNPGVMSLHTTQAFLSYSSPRPSRLRRKDFMFGSLRSFIISQFGIHIHYAYTDHSLSYMALWRFLKRFEHKSPVISAPRYRHGLYSNIRADSAQPSSRYLFSEHHAEIISEINRCYRNNSSSTSTEVVSRLKTRGIFVSCATVRRIRNHLGFKKATTKYCHAIRDENKFARANFFMEMLEAGTTFSSWVFTDECTVQVDCSTRFCFVKSGDQISRLRHRAKHPAKVPYLGWDFYAGATKLAILPGDRKIDSELYCRILESATCLSRSRCTTLIILTLGFCELVQDNAPPHKSRFTIDKLTEWGIETVPWPAESPDLNPIELVWGNMKTYVRKQGVRKLDDLKAAILNFWKTLTPDVCSKYVSGIRGKMRRVVQQRGRNIVEAKHWETGAGFSTAQRNDEEAIEDDPDSEICSSVFTVGSEYIFTQTMKKSGSYASSAVLGNTSHQPPS
ncbi:hypothetical protein OSTOST_12665 [Ostertagia ostertagi]